VASGLIQPTGLTFGSASGDTNNLYVSNSAVSDVIKISGATTATPTTATFITPGSGGLNFPAGLTFGPDGKLYVVDLGATTMQGNVLQYNADGSFSRVFTPTGLTDPGSLAFQFPSDALFDAQGHLVTANLGPAYPPTLAGSIYQYNSDGTFNQALVTSSQFPDMGTGTSGISPAQLALLSANTTVNGTLNPGAAGTPSVLTVGNVTFASTGTFAVALNGPTAGTGYGQLVSTGTVHLNNATLNVSVGYSAAAGDQFDILSDAAQPVAGTFVGLPEGSTLVAHGQLLRITYHGGASGHDVVLARLSGALVLSVMPASVTAGSPFSLTVTAVDAGGQVDTGYTGTVHFVASNGRMATYTFTTADMGTHTFSGLVLTQAGTVTVTATDTASPSLTGSTSTTVVAAAADHIAFSLRSTITAGMPFAITVTVQDAYGNTVTGFTDTVHFTLTGTATVAADYTFTPADMGQHTFQGLVLQQSGPYTLTATDDADPALTGNIMFTVAA
jgi:hypothetical protein